MAICLGCGLRQNGDDVEVATSGVWGDAPLDTFGADDQAGDPIYCDVHGQLRTTPPHTARTYSYSQSNLVSKAFGPDEAEGAPVTFAFTNPSAYRSCSVLFVYAVKWGCQVVVSGFAFKAEVVIDGADQGTPLARLWGVPAVDPYDMEEYNTESLQTTIAPGATCTIVITPVIDPQSGPGSGRFTNQGVGIRVMAVTI